MRKALVVVVPVVLIAAVVGLALGGFIQIPGLSPKKKQAIAKAGYGEVPAPTVDLAKKSKPVKSRPPLRQPKAEAAKASDDPAKGLQALAAVWNAVDVAELAKLTADWKEEELAKVLAQMETERVAKFLELVTSGDPAEQIKANPGRASGLSKRLQMIGSHVAAPS